MQRKFLKTSETDEVRLRTWNFTEIHLNCCWQFKWISVKTQHAIGKTGLWSIRAFSSRLQLLWSCYISAVIQFGPAERSHLAQRRNSVTKSTFATTGEFIYLFIRKRDVKSATGPWKKINKNLRLKHETTKRHYIKYLFKHLRWTCST